MKKKVWEFRLLDNPNQAIGGESDQFYTTDTEAFLIFRLMDVDFNPTTATLTLVNTSDKSVISQTVPVIDKEIEWEMTEEAIEHSGNWQAQLVYTQEKDGKDERYTSQVVQFDVQSHLLTGRKPTLVAIEDWDTFIANAKEFMDQLEDTADGIFIDIDELEQQYRVSEQNREDAENVREANESARQAEEAQRASSESIRVDNEQQREANESLRESSETERVSAEQSRITAENERNDLYALVQQKLENGEFVGEKGDTGDGLEYVWNGTQLGVRREGETTYQYVNLKGDKGDKGDTGEMENLDSSHIVNALGYTPISANDVPEPTWTNLQNKPTEFNPTSHTHVWSELTNKPSTFVPSTHTHSINDVTGLRAELDSVPELTKENVQTALGFSPLPSEGGNIKTYVETTSSPTVAGTTVLDLSLSNVFEVSLSQATTFSIINPDARTSITQSFTLIIHVGATPEAIVFPASVLWQGGEIPDLTVANKTYILTFMTVDNGMFWYGTLGSEFLGYVLSTDADFSGTSNENFEYIGTDEYLKIPHVIKGVNVTSYRAMFSGTSVKGVGSNNKDVRDMRYMFRSSQATSLDLSSFDTSGVRDMSDMFQGSRATSLDLSSFDTSSVTNMSAMFQGSRATSLDLSSFDTSGVRDMSAMFQGSRATSLDLSSFDTSSVTNMSLMFQGSQATIGYARTQADADRFNSSDTIRPNGLTFIVKP